MITKLKFEVGHRYLVKQTPYDTGATSVVVQETAPGEIPGLDWVFVREDVSGSYLWSDTLQIITELPIKEIVNAGN